MKRHVEFRIWGECSCGTLAGRQATHRMVIDAPSSSSDQQRFKVIEISHPSSEAKQRGAEGSRGGQSGRGEVEARELLAARTRGRLFAGFGFHLTLPYLTLPSALGGCQCHCKWVYAGSMRPRRSGSVGRRVWGGQTAVPEQGCFIRTKTLVRKES